MREAFVALIYGFVKRALTSVAQSVWDGMWVKMFDAVEEAEERWREEGYSEEKKEFVENKIKTYIDERVELNFFQRRAFNLFLSWGIDGMVEAIEDELGENWVESVEEYKEEIAGFISFVN